jgi:hypothetical protein
MKLTLKKGKKKTDYEIPSHWDELNLSRYMRIMKVLKDKEEIHDVEKVIRILNCLTDVPKKELYSLDIKSIGKLNSHLTKFLETLPNDEIKHFIEVEDKEYGFHPCLKDMTLGEFVDLETYMKDIDQNLHNILSVLYRPVISKDNKGKYRIEDYEPNEERANLFKKHLTVDDFNGASVFFYNLGMELSSNSLKSLIVDQKKIKTTAKH